MRIVFMGATELGWECCQTLFKIGQDVVGIFSIPQEFRISWSPDLVKNVRFKSFSDLAQTYSVPLINVTKKMSDPEYQAALRDLQPDLLIIIGWYYMVPRSLREIAPLGAIGIHASLLPKYRGGAPLVWAMINGETETGVSLFYLSDGVDDGHLIGQSSFGIDFAEDIAQIVKKSIAASVELTRTYVPMLAEGKAPSIPQDHSQATTVSQRKPEDGVIDWNSKSSIDVHNWIRAQTRPYPGAFTYINQEKLTIWKASVARQSENIADNYQIGEVVPKVSGFPNTFGICCTDHHLVYVREVQTTEGEVMSGAEFIAKKQITAGTKASL